MYLQYTDRTHEMCELELSVGEAMRLLGYLMLVQKQLGLPTPHEIGEEQKH